MPLNPVRVRRHLADFDLEPLFIEELGWDRYPSRLDVTVDATTYTLRGIAEKRGMVAFALETTDGQLPDHPLRRKIERQTARSVHEHVIVYTDEDRTTQVWQWVGRESGRTTPREHIYQRGQSGEALIQKLDRLVFTLDEEGGLTIVDVTRRARAAFDIERVTKRFYDKFKAEHDSFLGFITGLKTQEDLEWYASVMLNRLMFVYFIQRKGFLDGDREYLRNRLTRLQADAGVDQFHTFYRHFLLRLFHQGLGARERTTELDGLLGKVPYLNGGLFDVHELERAHPTIQIPDAAFERLFDFFDSYQWHLDDRPLRTDNEVNPDVLGYIFEKYVNQKQMGAYYTKEDITEYITSNTLLPRLLEKIAANTPEFSLEVLRRLLAADPDRYIPVALRHGVDAELPEEIAAGVGDASVREGWNAPATPRFALPTETWREVVARRQQYARLRETVEEGAFDDASDLVSLNLELRRLAEDVIETCDSPTLLLCIFRELESLSVLDPTCGSGAFLFAALNMLEPLYEAALERMEAFVVDAEADEEDAEFVAIIERVRAHPNRTFFVLKTILVNNLYGVDIMEEAVEICKLRLFLRLVSQVDRVEHLEPLPDIDFNVRAGNSLVGFASLAELRKALSSRLDLDQTAGHIQETTQEVDEAFERFRALQLADVVNDTALAEAKRVLRENLTMLRAELNAYLATDWGHDPTDEANHKSWLAAQLPFHWFIEFHEIMSRDGFDVIIGNPPYVEYRKVRDQYSIRGFETEPCGDLYAFVMERSGRLIANRGSFGMIVPVSVVSTDGFEDLRKLLFRTFSRSCVLSFAERPSKLFTGVEKRLTIWLGYRGGERTELFLSNYRRWFAEERPHLFATTAFVRKEGNVDLVNGSVPKIRSPRELTLLGKIAKKKQLASYLGRRSMHIVYYTRKLRYFVIFLDFVPGIRDAEGNELMPSELKELRLDSQRERDCVLAILNSSLFFWFFSTYSDVRNVNRREIQMFRCSLDEIGDDLADELGRLGRALMEQFNGNAKWLTSDYRKHGVLTIQSFQPRLSKHLIDEIDRALARHYGLDDDDVDFVTSFDLKYRMGIGEEETARED